jgi:hypothetical protein
MSGWKVRESTRMERERDLGGGFVRRTVEVRCIAVGRWFERQRRGRRRLVFVSSSWVRVELVLGFDAGEVSLDEEEEEEEEEEEDSGAMEGWETSEMMGFEGKETC